MFLCWIQLGEDLAPQKWKEVGFGTIIIHLWLKEYSIILVLWSSAACTWHYSVLQDWPVFYATCRHRYSSASTIWILFYYIYSSFFNTLVFFIFLLLLCTLWISFGILTPSFPVWDNRFEMRRELNRTDCIVVSCLGLIKYDLFYLL